MSENQLQRDLKKSMPELIKFLGDQATKSPEHTIAKIALEHRMQKKLIRPTWILAGATILTLVVTTFITHNQKQSVDKQIQGLSEEIQQLKLQMTE